MVDTHTNAKKRLVVQESTQHEDYQIEKVHDKDPCKSSCLVMGSTSGIGLGRPLRHWQTAVALSVSTASAITSTSSLHLERKVMCP